MKNLATDDILQQNVLKLPTLQGRRVKKKHLTLGNRGNEYLI